MVFQKLQVVESGLGVKILKQWQSRHSLIALQILLNFDAYMAHSCSPKISDNYLYDFHLILA